MIGKLKEDTKLYIIDGNSKVYIESDNDYHSYIMYAGMDKKNVVAVKIHNPKDNINNKNIYKITSADKGVLVDEVVIDEEDSKKAIVYLRTDAELELNIDYTIEIEGYGKTLITAKDIFDTKEFEDEYTYLGEDLGCTYLETMSVFKLWAPTATKVQIRFYKKPIGGSCFKELDMEPTNKGIWAIDIKENLKGLYYTYKILVDGDANEAVDPYAKAVGTNGLRAEVIDLKDTNPSGWEEDIKPAFKNPTDAIIYEAHIRDLSVDENSGITNKGKFLGLAEEGTKNKEGYSTGLDHLVELGITHIHLLPSFDFISIDESELDKNDFNWGYDPQNYNVPEGSYSTNPADGEVRISEFKKMVLALHKHNIRVIMDVVYNHTGLTESSDFNKIVPKYYHRTLDNRFTNASGCGNETASNRSMVRKFIIDSVKYWAKEYHIDGFRFDLMGIHDITTMNEIKKELDEIDDSIIVYGEGWTCDESPYPLEDLAVKSNTLKMPKIASFSDDIRDAIKGHVFFEAEKGFVSGAKDLAESLKFGIVGCIDYPDIDFDKVKYSKKHWANNPTQAINYVSAHDNLVLWDKLNVSNPDDDIDDLVLMDKMANAIVLTSQGIPFIHAGDEMLRSKDGDHNSYKSSDLINSIKWNLKTENNDVFEYYKGLIEFRKSNSLLRMATKEEVINNLKFLESGVELEDETMVGFKLIDKSNPDSKEIVVIYNPNKEPKKVNLNGKYSIYINSEKAGNTPIKSVNGNNLSIERLSACVLIKESEDDPKKGKKGFRNVMSLFL